MVCKEQSNFVTLLVLTFALKFSAFNMATIISLSWAMIERICTTLISPKRGQPTKPQPANPSISIRPNQLASDTDLAFLPSIEYAYDPLPAQPTKLNRCPPELSTTTMTNSNKHTAQNSVVLDPVSAGLPYRSSINCVRASKYWNANLTETLNLLQMLAVEHAASDIEVEHGITLAKLAKAALRPGREHQIVLATHYMFPSADEERMKQIAALTVLYFIFDGMRPPS